MAPSSLSISASASPQLQTRRRPRTRSPTGRGGVNARYELRPAVTTRIELPAHIDGEFEVYVNGIRQRAGVDYEQDGRELLFRRQLVHEGQLGFLRWASIFLGIAGTYRKHDEVDVVYER